MSKSLYIDCQRLDEPASIDPLERQTWAEFRLHVEDVCVTEFWNRHTESISKTLYMPLFEVADWMVRNWWALLYEPYRGESPPREDKAWNRSDSEWLARHCLRTADSSLFLPFLRIFSNGPAVSIEWSQDDRCAPTHMPGYFARSGSARLDRNEAEDALREFVAEVLRWCNGVNDPRVGQMRESLAAIADADADERSFCLSAGCMGLDPYAVETWPAGIADFIATTLGGRLHEQIVGDFLESTEPSSAPELWTWIDDIRQRLGLLRGNRDFASRNTPFRTPKDQGYSLARCLRQKAELAPGEPIDDLSSFSEKLVGVSVRHQECNHIPSHKVNAVVGWEEGGRAAVVAGPRPARDDNVRFLLSRGIYQAFAGCSEGVRLLTRASTWDQQASRAFAAELLAPGEDLVAEVSPDADIEEREDIKKSLAGKYGASEEVIRLQLYNQGVWR